MRGRTPANKTFRVFGDPKGLRVPTRGGPEFNAAAGDPTEDKGIACAVEGAAGSGIAGDIHLLTLERYAYTVILPPRRFPDVLEELKQSGG